MDIINPATYCEKLKRCWRRRRYQRLNGASNNKKKVKIMRLGGNCRRVWRIRAIPKLRLRIVSPVKLLAKFHDAYIDMMIRLAGNVENSSRGNKRIQKGCQVSMVSSGEKVDSRLVLEIYKRLASTRELAVF